MLQKFFTNTLESGFIKYLLSQVNIPLYKTVYNGDRIIKDCLYAYKGQIIKADSSGIIGSGANYSIIRTLVEGENDPTFTSNYISTSTYYDSETHRMLGRYLRWYRDTYGIDLMPFYNCFNYAKVDYDFTEIDGSYEYVQDVNPLDNTYKNLIVPCCLDREYTIAIDCSSTIVICPIIFYHKTVDAKLSKYMIDQVKFYGGCSFKSPIIYKIDTSSISDTYALQLANKEKDLYLMIRVPINNDSSIVVLEGNYKNNITDNILKYGALNQNSVKQQSTNLSIVNFEYQQKINNYTLNNSLLSGLNLLKFNDNNTYAYSDTLIEYLTGNVITSRDEYEIGIANAQNYTNKTINMLWDINLRVAIYNKFMSNNKVDHYDINGFVNKPIEHNIATQ